MVLPANYFDYPFRRPGMDHDRYAYSSLFKRKSVQWPNEARIALWVLPTLEFFPLETTSMGVKPAGGLDRPFPDYWNYTLRDYGNRVGFARIFRALEARRLKASIAMSSRLAERYPHVLHEVNRLAFELVAHGIDMDHIHASGISREVEREWVERSLSTLRKLSGQPVKGWYSPAYGRIDRATTVRVGHGGGTPFWMMSVFDLNPQNVVTDVECLPVWAEAGTTAHATGLRITRAGSVDYALFVEPAAARGATWRVGEFETDARALFCRVTGDRPVARVALVDGSFVRTPGRRGIQFVLPRAVPAVHVDFGADARVAGAAQGARLVVGGHEQPVATDRRSAPRESNRGVRRDRRDF